MRRRLAGHGWPLHGPYRKTANIGPHLRSALGVAENRSR